MNNRVKIITSICGLVGFLLIAVAMFFILLGNNFFYVTFDTDGGSTIAVQKIKKGEKILKPDNPIKEGYSFTKWEYNKEEYDFTNSVYNNMVLKAIWKKNEEIQSNKYKIIFKLASQTKTFEVSNIKEIDLDNLGFEKRKGYIIKWYVNGKEYDFNKPLTGDIIIEGKYEKAVSYTVKFDSDGGTKVDNQIINKGEKITKPSNPTKVGYIFVEWQLEGKTYDFNSLVTKDIILRAKWEENQASSIKTYTITFDSAGGGNIPIQKVKEGEKVAKPSDPTKTGYKFIEWQLEGKTYDFNSLVTKDIILRAKWEENQTSSIKTYTITFDSAGGSNVASQKVKEGEKAIRPANPTKNGQSFVSWQLDGVAYDFNRVVNKDIKLVATWTTNLDTPIFADGTINNAHFNIIKDGGKSSGLINSKGINNAILYASQNGIKNIKLENGNYYLSAENDYSTTTTSVKREYAIIAQDNVNFNLNGSTLALVENSHPYYAVILMKDCDNFKIMNGIIKGDRLLHTCGDGSLLEGNVLSNNTTKCSNDAKTSHEWGYGCQIYNSSNISISDLEITDLTGDGISMSKASSVNITNNNVHYVRRNGISIISGDYITIKNNEIHDINGTNPRVGIDIEKDHATQLYSNITIENNRIYNTVNQSIDVFNKIYNLTIKNNEMSNVIFARVKPRKALDASDSDEFPTNVDDAYLMNKYNIIISGNKVIGSNIPKEHDNYSIKATSASINTLNYKGYIALKSIKETNGATEYNLKVKKTMTIPVTWGPPSPTYKVLSYESSDTSIAKVSTSGTITAVSEGTAKITVTATDYGADPISKDDDKTHSFEITVNVSK